MSTGRVILALILIAIGLFVLAGNLDLLDWDLLAGLWQLWPLLLIILGIGLFFGRRRPGLAWVLIGLVVLVGVALAVFAIDVDSRRLAEDNFVGPQVAGTQSGLMVANLGALELDIRGEEMDNLVEADFRVRGNMEISDTGPGGDYEVEFSQETGSFVFPFFDDDGGQSADIRLAAGVPWSIDIDIGAADANLDLRRVSLASLQLDAGASSLDVRLGEDVQPGAVVSIDGGAGSFDISVPESLTVTVRTDTGLSSNDLDEGFEEIEDDVYLHDGGGPEVEVVLRAGVSSLNVELD
jgi:hypothetical protein